MFHRLFSDNSDDFWRFYSDTKLYFCLQTEKGRTTALQLIDWLEGVRPLVISDAGVSATTFFINFLKGSHFPQVLIKDESDLLSIESAVALARREKSDLILAVGGGSVLDAAKIVAAAVGAGVSPVNLASLDCLERAPLSLIAVPTTFGTGSEVNIYSHITLPDQKISLRKSWLAPTAAIIVPQVAFELPERLRYLTAVDSWVHAFEALTLKCENSPMQRAILIEALSMQAKNFAAYVAGPTNDTASAIATASTLAGIALSNARTGLIHALATPFAKLAKFSHAESLLPFIRPALEFNWPYIKVQLTPVVGEERLDKFCDAFLSRAERELSEWRLSLSAEDIQIMVEVCERDHVLIKENPAPLQRESFVMLYRSALERWLA